MGASFPNQPRTPSVSPPPEDTALPPIPKSNGNRLPPRRSSFSFLRRSKSGENHAKRSGSGAKLTKKQHATVQQQNLERQQREAAAVPQSPPSLPQLALPPILRTGDDSRPDSVAIVSNQAGGYNQAGHFARGPMEVNSSGIPNNIPIPPIPQSPPDRRQDGGDSHTRTESMTHRGRYSYASSMISTINSPRRVRRRKDPTPFNILIIGARNSGKTSFLNFLRTSLALPPRKRQNSSRPPDDFAFDLDHVNSTRNANPSFTSEYLETELDGERIGLTLWDSEGLEKSVVDLQLRDMSAFIESKFEETFNEEMKVIRAPGVQDTHIHCAFLILDPIRLDASIAGARPHTNGAINGTSRPPNGLDEGLDLQVLRTLQGKTTVIPIISKADTLTTAHMAHLKRTVWDSLKQANLDPLEAMGLDITEADEESDRDSHINKKDEVEEDEYNLTGKPAPIPGSFAEDSITSSGENGLSTPEPKAKRVPSGSALRRTLSSMSSSTTSTTETPYLPLSIISPDVYDPETVGRKFPWGFADPYNETHCDFVRLREAVFKDWRGELREASRELWYEGWRTNRLNRQAQQIKKVQGPERRVSRSLLDL
ncbi:MAG: hypothetical protein M1835_007211 [Candelina submexicana]|nr:MAG: hypothetical protein M1835_007211 [Candelina submexicana]